MQFTPESPLYSEEVNREGGEDVLYINYLGAPFVPSLSDYPEVMEKVVDSLIKNPNVSRVVLVQQKNYNYDFKETSYLLELAQLYVHFVRQEKILSPEKLGGVNFNKKYNDLYSFLFLLKRDPVSAYYELKRIYLEAKAYLNNLDPSSQREYNRYILFVEKIYGMLKDSKLITDISEYFDSYKLGSRDIYHRVFKPDTIPNFSFSRLVSDLPDDSDIVSQYKIGGGYDESRVTILRVKNEAKLIYHLVPPENNLSEEHNYLLNLARGVLLEHQPKAEEFTDT
jgi:hypothetical protein